MIPLVVIRPAPGCDATVGAARAMGLEAQAWPLFAIRPLEWEAPDPATIDGLLIGSANAMRQGGPALDLYIGKPVWCVGKITALAAKARGHDVIAVGEGGLQALLDGMPPGQRRLLRLAGRERVVLHPPAGTTLIERVVYASEPQPLAPGLARLLERPVLVLLHSAEAARHFASLCPDRANVSLACLAPRIAEAAGEGWRALEALEKPDDAALLALAARMCQDGSPSGKG